jgi:hypothetical protein
MDLREPLGSGTGVSGPGARGPEKIHPIGDAAFQIVPFDT